MRARWLVGALGLVTVAGCAAGPVQITTDAPFPAPLATSAPTAPGRVAWQAAIGADPVVEGGVIVARAESGVQEFDARTGARRWSFADPRQPAQALEFTIADNTVFAVVGHDIGHAPAMVGPVAAELDALDLRTGRLLWSHPIAGQTQTPGLAAAGGVLAVADNSTPGVVVGLAVRTGQPRWRDAPPAGCTPPRQYFTTSTYLAGDDAELAVGRECAAGNGVIQGLDPSTGRPRWTFSASPAKADDFGIFTVPAGSHVLAAVIGLSDLAAPTQQWAVPDSPEDGGAQNQQLVVFDADTGAPQWRELAVSSQASATGDASVLCLTAPFGYECRHTATGALTFPPPAAQPQLLGGPYGDSGPDAEAGDLVYQLDSAFHLVTRSALTGAVRHTATLPLTDSEVDHGVSTSGLITAGSGLVLARRADQPGFPVLAATGS